MRINNIVFPLQPSDKAQPELPVVSTEVFGIPLYPGYVIEGERIIVVTSGSNHIIRVQGTDVVDQVLGDVEWSVLLFFAALFVAVGGVEASGLLGLVAEQLTALTAQNLLLAGIVLIWVAALISAVVDNIPFTIVMIPVIQSMGAAGININPLWWALALGAGFGGNGTPIGSTANVVTIAISEKTETPITTKVWMRVGLPVMLVACAVGTVFYILTFGSMQ